jgi:hypothetical protein
MNRSFVAFATLAVASVVAPPLAQAQYYGAAYGGQPPLYPYAVQADRAYAVEVAPNTYVIRRPAASRAHSYLGRAQSMHHHASAKAREDSRRRRVAKAGKHGVVETRKVVHEKPVVIETQRVVERRHDVEDASAARQKPSVAQARVTGNIGKRGGDKLRVIHAEAEVTILGPDRMSIRLFRRRAGRDAKASAD